MATKPLLEDLSLELNTTRIKYKSLMQQYESLSSSYERLEDDFAEVKENYTILLETTVSREEYDELVEIYNGTQQRLDLLEAELADERSRCKQLNYTYWALKEQYDALVEEFKIRVLPLSADMTINDLDITLTLDKTTFTHSEQLTGQVKINHTVEPPFRGEIILSVRNEFFNVFLHHEPIDINGETVYSIEDAFMWGAGRYSIGLYEIRDDGGIKVASYNDLKDFRLLFEVT